MTATAKIAAARAALATSLKASRPLLEADQIAAAVDILLADDSIAHAVQNVDWLQTQEGAADLLRRHEGKIASVATEAPSPVNVYEHWLSEQAAIGGPVPPDVRITLYRRAHGLSRDERAATCIKAEPVKAEPAKKAPAPQSVVNALPGRVGAPNYSHPDWDRLIEKRTGRPAGQLLASQRKSYIDALLASASDGVPLAPDDGRPLTEITSVTQRMTLARQRARLAAR
ncbi:MAG: hypothetical protein JNM89_02185 [Hyphomicrobiaceae bacterium]|nr:hypothetical protein [Hyphomicrobiaceae bacterium]